MILQNGERRSVEENREGRRETLNKRETKAAQMNATKIDPKAIKKKSPIPAPMSTTVTSSSAT